MMKIRPLGKGTVIKRLAHFLQRWHKERTQEWIWRRAVDSAYELFAQHYPTWANSLFDQILVQCVAPEAVRKWSARELAEAWTRQLSYEDEGQRQRHVQQVTPVAEAFLQLVWAEVSRRGGGLAVDDQRPGSGDGRLSVTASGRGAAFVRPESSRRPTAALY